MFRFILAILLWLPKVPFLFLMDALTYIFAPVLALFVTKAEEHETTGFPSMFPGKPREFLIKPLRWFQTFDAPLDEFWYGDYPNLLKTKYNQEYYDTHWWLRYVMRILWLWRNPAYGFGHALGYDTDGMIYTVQRDNTHLWGSGLPNSSFWRGYNKKNQIGWWYKAQIYFYKNRCLEVNLGYKLDADSPDTKKVVAMQFSPFRKYDVKT